MMKLISFLLLLLSFGTVNSDAKEAQSIGPKQGQALIDSLLQELPRAAADTTRVKMLGVLSASYSKVAPPKGLEYGTAALALAQKLRWSKGEMLAYKAIGVNHTSLGDIKTALEDFTKALAIAETLKDKAAAAGLLTNIGVWYAMQGNYAKGLGYMQQSLKISEEIKNKPGIAYALSNIGATYSAQGNYDKALEVEFKALKIFEELGDRSSIASSLRGIGNKYKAMNFYTKALDYYARASKINQELGDKKSVSTSTRYMGNVYYDMKEYDKAFNYYQQSLKQTEELGDKRGIAENYEMMGNIYVKKKQYKKAIPYTLLSMKIASEIGNNNGYINNLQGLGNMYLQMAQEGVDEDGHAQYKTGRNENLTKAIHYLKEAAHRQKEEGSLHTLSGSYKSLAEAYKLLGNYKEALNATEQQQIYHDSIFNKESSQKIARLEMESEYEKKEEAMKYQQQIMAQKLEVEKLTSSRNRGISFGLGGAMFGLGFVALAFYQQNKKKQRMNVALGEEKKKSDDLLLNILPTEVAEELKTHGTAAARHFDEVTILFTDFVDFTVAGEKMSAQELVSELHNCFKVFDEIISKYNIEKIKTIGDAYLAVGGIPLPDEQHADNVVRAALEIRQFMVIRKQDLGDRTFDVRIGIHSGPVVAGIVGVKKFAYDIWGDTVNTAARMEQSSEAGRVNISHATYERVKDKFLCNYRGEIPAKNKGVLQMYYVEQEKILAIASA